MYYFGTSLTEYGHYIHDISNGFIRIGLNFRSLPFNPEELTNNLPKGETIYYQGGGYTVFGISGSCIDERSGTESIFWVKENLSRIEMIRKVKDNLIASKIINNMPFDVHWPEKQP